MFLTLKINDVEVLLQPKDAMKILELVADCESVKSEYKRPEGGGDYMYMYSLEPVPPEAMKAVYMPESRYNQLKFFTAAKAATK